MSTKERSRSPLKCCQSSESLASTSAGSSVVCEAQNRSVRSPEKCNNNNLHLSKQEVKKHHFPKKQACDVNFQDIRYTASTWSMTRFKRGKFNSLSG